MSFKSGVTTRVDNAKAILDALRSLTKKDVLVGIPSEDSERDDVPFGNAGIGYLNEYGSPEQNIPPRPHLVTDQNTDGNITLSGTTAQPASIATDGVYIVRGIMYTGDTRGQAWYMDMMCEARGAADLLSSSAQQRIYS
ncbi:TPA: hypothetical protein JW640_001108 [Escherichia coli]|nr:hypothetical protein [Escherichia coli]